MTRSDFLDLNLLPRDRRGRAGARPRRARVPEALGLTLILFALLTLIPLTVLKVRNDRQLERTRAMLDSSREQVRAADELLAREAYLRQQIQELLLQADALEQQLRQLEAQGPPISELLQPLTEALPPRVTITGLVETDDQRVRVTGEGGSLDLVLEFAEAVERVPRIRKVTVVNVDRLRDPAVPPTAVIYTLELER